ncbi:MAG: DUF4810 domain-containing protein [Marinagarivorans sp.]|nr:DUF4810 domain-containing protein [Marinagarivorans sp.]
MKTYRYLTAAILAAAFLMATGCASRPKLYYWGAYEDVINSYYTKPGSMPAERQIELLSREIEQANNKKEHVAPGVYAQLGLAYADMGNVPASEAAFNREAELFPEAKPMLDGMIKRARDNTLKNSKKSQGAL